MFLTSVVFLSHVLAQQSTCNPSNDDETTSLNSDCSDQGMCLSRSGPRGTFYACSCCAPQELVPGNDCGDNWTCDPQNPDRKCLEFHGTHCDETREYIYADFYFRSEEDFDNVPGDVVCTTDPELRKNFNNFTEPTVYFNRQVEYVAAQYNWTYGVQYSLTCDTCSEQYPCEVGTQGSPTTGYTFDFQVDFNTFYNVSCGSEAVHRDSEDLVDCPANYDFGQLAHKTWQYARGDIPNDLRFLNDLNDLLRAKSESSNEYLGLGWNNTRLVAMSENVLVIEHQDYAPTPLPTNTPTTPTPTTMPTRPPTAKPTLPPTQSPTSECQPYTNDVSDLSYLGVGSNCRGGLQSSWPGGLTCNSPYVVCLPQENTPNAAFGEFDYKASTHRYSVDECMQECANDQRCSGIEFVADSSSTLGDCYMIDDIPIVITEQITQTTFKYLDNVTYTTLDRTITGGGDALCFAKQGYCNPSFGAEDLTDRMLNCYCPNNRKGFYTKKVKRTEANTKFCGDDAEVNTRIRKAQANRMFHLCQNWCLFQTENPEAETWYYDPWKVCWREQYAGVGAHMSFCNRVIRSPDSMEMQFVKNRVKIACKSSPPTNSPTKISESQWFMADEEDSCDDVCSANGAVCDGGLTASVVDPTQVADMFAEALGEDCTSIETGELDWALPGYEISSGTCLTMNPATENTGCNWALGVGYKRLCACN